jgi:HPt (histidine-containing phosphotransfer) domain-containing protein
VGLPEPLRRGQWLAMLNQRLNPATGDVLDADALDRLRELDPKGANQLLQRVLTAFQSSTARLVPQVRDACAAGDLTGVRHVAHTLKSSSASIGATTLAQMCSDIESMIRLDQVETLAPRVDAMCAEIDIVLQALKHLLNDES